MVTRNVYIVYGPPASGKSTYVREHKKKGDLVVDFDLIKQAISMNGKTEDICGLYNVAEGIREYLLTLIESRKINCANAWVIGSLADAAERIALKCRLKGELIYMNTTKEQCVARAIKDEERLDKELQLKIIDKWFENYTTAAIYTKERW